MFDRVVQSLATAAGRTSPRYALTLAACVLLALAGGRPFGHVQAAAIVKHPVRPSEKSAVAPATAPATRPGAQGE